MAMGRQGYGGGGGSRGRGRGKGKGKFAKGKGKDTRGGRGQLFRRRKFCRFTACPGFSRDIATATSAIATPPISHSTCRFSPASVCRDRCSSRKLSSGMPAGV